MVLLAWIFGLFSSSACISEAVATGLRAALVNILLDGTGAAAQLADEGFGDSGSCYFVAGAEDPPVVDAVTAASLGFSLRTSAPRHPLGEFFFIGCSIGPTQHQVITFAI